ncbi:hypothetical protein J6T66_00130 [bacterium]|nr:hypothetical protein [bacterium]
MSTIDNFFDDIKTIVNENNNIDKKLQDKKAERLNNDEQKKVWLEKLNPNSYEKLLLKTA